MFLESVDMKCKVNEAIIEFCIDVLKEPFIYFSEQDLHFLLGEKLLEKISKLNKLDKTSLQYIGKEEPYKTRLLHMEYGGKNKNRVDLAILTEKDVNDINHHHLTKDAYSGYLSPRFAFELGINIIDTEKHIKNDIKKLENCQEMGFIIHIYRDNTIAREDTKTRKDKTAAINNKFKMVIEQISKTLFDNIRIIAIVLYPRRKNEEKWIKCEIFNKQNASFPWYHTDTQCTPTLYNLLFTRIF